MAGTIPTTDRQWYTDIAQWLQGLLGVRTRWKPPQLKTALEENIKLREAPAVDGRTVTVKAGFYREDIAVTVKGGVDTDDATATEGDIRYPKTAYARGEKLTGTLRNVEQATPALSVSNTGLITARAAQDAGYVDAGTKSATQQLPTQAGKTVTPGKTSQVVVQAGRYTTGAVYVSAVPIVEQAAPVITVSSSGLITASATQTEGYVDSGVKTTEKQVPSVEQADPVVTIDSSGLITATVEQKKAGFIAAESKTGTLQLSPVISGGRINPGVEDQVILAGTYIGKEVTISGDSDLKPDNIKKGVTIYTVTGTMETDLDTSDATAFPAVIFKGYTAYVDGVKITGTYEEKSRDAGVELLDWDLVTLELGGALIMAGYNDADWHAIDLPDFVTVLEGWS